MALSSGFRKQAEAIAEEVREDLGVGNLNQLDPRALFEHLAVPLKSLTQLANESPAGTAVHSGVRFLRSQAAAELSAMTVFRGAKRIVIYNDGNDPGRQASDLCHEAGHALLLHEPFEATDDAGCRIWDQDIEDEASWLGGALLIPGKAARYAARAGWTFAHMAARFGCSEEMARWRNNVSGGQRLR